MEELWLMSAETVYFGFSVTLPNQLKPGRNNDRCNEHRAAGNKLINPVDYNEERQLERC